jgi:hypothetical protein
MTIGKHIDNKITVTDSIYNLIRKPLWDYVFKYEHITVNHILNKQPLNVTNINITYEHRNKNIW